MAERANLSRRSAFGGVMGGPASRIRDVATVPPGRTGTSILAECFDGDNAPWNNVAGQMPAECCLASDGYVFPYGQPRWLRFGLSLEAVATFTGRDWHFICESHFASSSTSAPWAMNLQTVNGRPTFQFVYTPIGWQRQFPEATRRQITYGEWTEVCIAILPHVSNGWIEVWYDGVKVWEVRGVRTWALEAPAYMIIGPYRPIAVNGRTAGLFHDMRVFDARPALGPYGSTTPPPPPPEEPTMPVVSIDTNDSGVYAVTLSDYGNVASLLLGVAGDPFPPISLQPADTLAGQFPADSLTPGTTYWSWIVARDAAGRELASGSDAFTPADSPPPPPDPDPVDPCAEIRQILAQTVSDLNGAREGRDQALDRLTTLRSLLAAEEIRHAQAIASILDSA